MKLLAESPVELLDQEAMTPADCILDTDPREVVRAILDATRDYEFDTFVIGIQRPPTYVRELHDSAYRDLKIRLGTILVGEWPQRRVEFDRPEIRIDLRACGRGRQDEGERKGRTGVRVGLQSVPLFIGGRYRKLSREIPACRWMHLACKGNGCPACGFTGNICGPSIQELAEPDVLEATGGEATFFHGAGREDVNVRMLGLGRPFVLEVRHPKRRVLDLEVLTGAINDAAEDFAEVHRLALTTRAAIVAAKSCAAEKTYRVRIRFDGEVPPDLPQRLETLGGVDVEQLSPRRVMKRRGQNTLRRKRIIESCFIGSEGDEHVWELRTSSGTYIKELVTGDDGRTRPSVAELVGVACECAVLDVMDVHWTPPWEGGATSASARPPPDAVDSRDETTGAMA